MALGLSKQLEAQGPVNWSIDDLRTKYRDEGVRMEAWEACQDALRDAEILEREQGMVVPVVVVDPHPVFRGVVKQIEEENSLSQRRYAQPLCTRSDDDGGRAHLTPALCLGTHTQQSAATQRHEGLLF